MDDGGGKKKAKGRRQKAENSSAEWKMNVPTPERFNVLGE
jgi:hypothetical protein